MDITVDNIEQFKVFFDVVFDNISADDIELQLDADRMVCTVLDGGRTRMFHVIYEADFFEKYSIDDVSSVTVSLEDMHNLLKSVNRTDILHLQLNDPYLVAEVESKTGNKRLFEFTLPNGEVNSPTPPQAEFPAVFDVDVSVLKQSVKDIGLVGTDLFIFVVNNNQLTVTSDNVSAVKYANTVDIVTDEHMDEQVTSRFTLKFIEQLCKFDKISKKVKLKIGENYPLFYVFDDPIMGVAVTGMIAPRIPEEEE